ncbi:MAG: T9SS type A sorting domain-containing protein, partial [Candidatus Delongbacteria bacterium]|nr:T9SS type A sorting domain-containing protein [Candidatus Delongbacteria bacterium]
SNLKTKFLHPDHPFGVILDDYGLLSGTLITENENTWNLKLKITDWNGFSSIKILPLSTTTGINTENIPNDPILLSNYPNPFNPTTKINFSLVNDDRITLRIYNIKGEIVETLIDDKFILKGDHSLLWDPSKTYSSGIYFYGIESLSGSKQIKKMTILK